MTIWKRKWFLPVVLSLVLIGGITGGVVAAANNSSNNTTAGNESQITDRYQALLDRVCAIYKEKTGVALDSEQLKAALQQARIQMQDEALKNWLQKLVDNGKITQGEADQLLEWWQSRPDVQLPLPRLGRPARGGGMIWGRGFQSWGSLPCDPGASDEADG